jgi:hypothetical protein
MWPNRFATSPQFESDRLVRVEVDHDREDPNDQPSRSAEQTWTWHQQLFAAAAVGTKLRTGGGLVDRRFGRQAPCETGVDPMKLDIRQPSYSNRAVPVT